MEVLTPLTKLQEAMEKMWNQSGMKTKQSVPSGWSVRSANRAINAVITNRTAAIVMMNVIPFTKIVAMTTNCTVVPDEVVTTKVRSCKAI